MKKNLWIFLLFTLCFTSCHKRLKQKKIKEISTNFIYTPITLDPRKGTDPVSASLHFMIYEGLMHLESDGKLSFALAKSFEISKDRLIYTFHLRKTNWSNGTSVTAYDFESSWKEAIKPNFPSPTSHFFFPIKNAEKAKLGLCSIHEVGIYAINDETFVVELEKPTPYFLQLTAYPTFFPIPASGKEVLPPHNGRIKLISNGPFELIFWKNEDEIFVQKNPHYWNASVTKLDRIHITIVSDEGTALDLFEKGKLDWVGGLISPLPVDAIPSLSDANKIHIQPIAGINFCTFNTEIFPFNNIHIRKAFAYAINRKTIVDNVTQMFDEATTALTPQILNRCSKQAFEDAQLEKAKEHFQIGLKELRLQKLPLLTYSYFSTDIQKKLAVALQSQWREVLGVDIQLENFELKVFLNQLRQKDFQFAQMSWIAQYNDPISFLERFLKKDSFRNYTNWENIDFQNLLNSSYELTNQTVREQKLYEAELLLINEMPIVPLYHYNALYLTNPHLKNIEISPLGHVYFHKTDIE